MAWNEPGNNKDKDPWKSRGANGQDQGPPDLDEALGKFLEKLNGLFGGRTAKTGSSGSGNNDGGNGGFGDNQGTSAPSGKLLGVLIVIALVVWAGMGFYTVDQQERAVVLRLGKFHDVVQPGLQWYPPFIDIKENINVTAVRDHQHVALMLTEDENIVEVGLTVQYVVDNPKDFYLEIREPERSLAQATESALRHVVGSSKMDNVLTEGRAVLADDVQARLQNYLDSYKSGLQVIKVNIENTSAPSQVQDAFDDVIKAREDEQRVKNEAQTYANGIVPEARGQAQRLTEESNAYRDEVVAKAEGEAERFTKLLTEYKKSPEVTRERLYIVAMEDVLSNSSKVLIDVENGNNMMVLPLEQILNSTNQRGGRSSLGQNFQSNSDIDQLANRVIQEINSRSTNTGRNSSRESR